MTDLRSQLQATLGSSYTLERELGGGGMSRVFVADENAYGRKVVVKVLPPDVGAGVNADRFKREIQVAARLLHPHIVPVLTSGEMDGVPFYTMPFVEGQSLRDRLVRGGPLSITEAVGTLRDIAKALAYAHDHGVVHRDIKPDNVLLSGGSAAVADFGIAKAISAARDEDSPATLTQIGTSLGTPAYMAPEQAAADPATNHRADIYAFGCVAYEVLAGRPPFVAKTPQRLLAAQMGEIPEPVSQHRPDTPSDLAALVMRCLAKDADERPQSAQELVRVLETVTSGGGHAAMPSVLAGGPGMFRKALMYYGAAFVAVLIITQAAVVAIGLPDWVLPGAAVVMLLGLPVILFTGYVQRVTRRALTMTPTYTPGGTPSMPVGTMATLAMKASPHVSWHRTARGGMLALTGFILIVGAFMTLRALGIGPAASLFAAGKLSKDEPFLVTDFAVRGNADSTLGGIVSEALRTDLGQSNVIRIMPASAIRDALQRMQRPVTSRIDAGLAREIALRHGMRAIIDGDITPLGSGFLVTTKVLAAESGDALASFSEIADTPRDLIATVGRLGRQLRGKIGESIKSVRETPPLDAVSTQSLDALRKYVEGSRANDIEGNYAKSIELFKEAVAIDTAFAMGWRKIATVYDNLGMTDQADTAIARAYRLRERLPETERQNVIGYYYHLGPGQNRVKAVAAYEALVNKGNIGAAANNLGLIYMQRREFARAESLYRRQIAAGNTSVFQQRNLVAALVYQGKAAAAESVVLAMMRRVPPPPDAPLRRAYFLYRRGQHDSLARLLETGRTNADAVNQSTARGAEAALHQVGGRLAAALRTRNERRAIDSARGNPAGGLDASMDSSQVDAWYRDQAARAVARLDAALVRSPLGALPLGQRPYLDLARTYAMAGRPDRARALLAQYAAAVQDTTTRRADQPQRLGVLAEIALAEGKHEEAIATLRASFVLPDGPVGPCGICDSFALGRAFDRADNRDSAIVYYARYFDGSVPGQMFQDQWMLPVVHKRLGELYEAKGERQNAYTHYARFVDLWKNADADLQPKVQDVRRRMARLKDVER